MKTIHLIQWGCTVGSQRKMKGPLHNNGYVSSQLMIFILFFIIFCESFQFFFHLLSHISLLVNQSLQSRKQLKMIIFIRHAQRGDNQLPQVLSQIQYDPPIINQAKQTIQATSKEISFLFKKHGIKKFEVRCSKFLRCLMTMKALEDNLASDGFQPPAEYILDDRICEYLRESWFPYLPLDNLIYKTENAEKYVKNLKYQQKKANLHFPQTYPHFHHRITDFKKELKFPQSETCIIVMTHGFVVRQISFKMNELPKFEREVKYCGYVAYTLQNSNETLLKSKL